VLFIRGGTFSFSPPELLLIIWLFYSFTKGSNMENVRNDNGTCGCGRSPTGDCIGWHMLSAEEFEAKTDQEKAATFEDSE
jgi:hypothetical protein|tara:strand:+ start:1451 stop:1690 length:240 start_codon:yes stop_codon:yes gene_type:complete